MHDMARCLSQHEGQSQRSALNNQKKLTKFEKLIFSPVLKLPGAMEVRKT